MGTGSYLLNNLCEEAWYLVPGVLKTYEKVLDNKFVHGVKFGDIKENNIASNPLKLDSSNGKAVIDIEGTMVRKAGFLDALCGIVGMNEVASAFTQALVDPKIDHIILNWDSPGGSAIGTPELAELVYSGRGEKRITSFVAGQMCSAAYFVGSAAHEIYASSPICAVGSIGVVRVHVDQSAADQNEGLKYTYIHAGEHKVDGNPHESLSPEVRAEWQEEVNYTYGVFLDAVQKHRGVDRETLMQYAEGKVFHAAKLIGTPMLDGIATLDEILRS